MSEIPLIDVSAAMKGGRKDKVEVAEQISNACRDIGFFTIKGHGIDKKMINEAYENAWAFFALEREQKEMCRREDGEKRVCVHQFDGYSALLEESADALMGREVQCQDYVEKFGMGRWLLDDDKNMPFPQDALGITMRKNMKAYYEACLNLTHVLTELMAIAAGLPDDFFVDKIDNSLDFMRFQHYPQVTGNTEYDKGISEHTDPNFLTILTGTSGRLEVETKSGEWVNGATEEVDHFVVNVGDLMMRWSNDEWLSNVHRVALADKERMSLIFFKVVNEDAVIEAFDKFCTEGKPRKYEKVIFSEYMNAKAAALYGS
jgi:isopenicillin N synthase-like dioxygenase